MLFSFVLSLTSPADACVAPASVKSTYPVSGTLDVAPDAHFQLQLGCEPLFEDPTFFVEQDGEVVEATVTFHKRMITADAEAVFVELEPVEELKVGASVVITMEHFGMPSTAAAFVIGEQHAPAEIVEVPEIYWMSTYDVSFEEQEEPEEGCWLQKEGEIVFDVQQPEEDNMAIQIYQIDPELRGETLYVDMLDAPFHTILSPKSWDDMSALIPTEVLQADDLCFTATFLNEAGVESKPSEVRCINDMDFEQFECGTGLGMMGCSTMQPLDLGWMAMLMGTLGLVRRRNR